jgi:DNA modification methylase
LPGKAKNTLNDLDAKEWVKATKSWFVINPRSRSQKQKLHPAKFPEELVKHFLAYFTKRDSWVIDPFAGVGSTLVACKELDRNGVGIELSPEFVRLGRALLNETSGNGTQLLIEGNSANAIEITTSHFDSDAPVFDYLITSPPYWNMLRKSRGGNDSVHRKRGEQGLKQYYSESEHDIGNLEEYGKYIDSVSSIITSLKPQLASGAYLTIVVQNMRDVNGVMQPIAWDLGKKLSNVFSLKQEMIWCQDNKPLGCWGYPTTYVSNVHHHTCLIFQN